jgi:CBS domain-containing protein/anti-sigma regulatory factor (Ser/Thr protein kinase)
MKNAEVPPVPTIGRAEELLYELKVDQAMTTAVVAVTPDDTMEDLWNIMREKQISGTPVLQEDLLVGIVSIEDLVKSLHQGQPKAKVKEKMSTNVVTLYSDEPIVHALNQFRHYRYGRFPVIDRKTRKLLGMLTKGDIVRRLLKKLETNHAHEELAQYRAGHLFEDIVSDKATLTLRYRVEGGNFEKAGNSSRMKNSLLKVGIHPATARRITIASYEAEMNIVVFTQGGELIAAIEPDRVTVNAVDNGPGISDVELAMQPGYSTAPDWVRELGFGAGMGLPNIKNCSDEMKIDSNVGKGTNLQFTVYTKK